MNKRGFNIFFFARCLFAASLLPLLPFLSLFLLHIIQTRAFFSFFPCIPAGLDPVFFRIALAYSVLSLSSTPLHY